MSGTDEAWLALRTAVSEEFIEKLPESLGLSELCILTNRTIEVIVTWIDCGMIIIRGDGPEARMWPADNRPFLMNEMLLLLPLPTAAQTWHRSDRQLSLDAPRTACTPTLGENRLLGSH